MTVRMDVHEYLCWLDGEPENSRVVEAVDRRDAAERYMRERHARDLGDAIGDNDTYVVCVSVPEGEPDFGGTTCWGRMTKWTVRAVMTFKAVPK